MMKLKEINELLNNEKIRSSLTSTASGIFTFLALALLEFFDLLHVKDNNTIQYKIFIIFCFLVGYSLDIIFAKQSFDNKVVPYDKINDRLDILVNQYYKSFTLIKYLMIVILDNIVNIIVVRYLINQLNKYKILVNYKYRDILLVFVVFGLSFILYSNYLRFNWAYNKESSKTMNIVMAIITISTMIIYTFVVNKIDTKNVNKKKIKVI